MLAGVSNKVQEALNDERAQTFDWNQISLIETHAD